MKNSAVYMITNVFVKNSKGESKSPPLPSPTFPREESRGNPYGNPPKKFAYPEKITVGETPTLR